MQLHPRTIALHQIPIRVTEEVNCEHTVVDGSLASRMLPDIIDGTVLPFLPPSRPELES